MSTNPITLTRHILAEQRYHGSAQGDLTLLLNSIQLACKAVATSVRKAGIANLYGITGATNVQGEEVKKLDIVANENFINALSFSERVSVMASEENETIITISEHLQGKYVVVFDPLDGSSNIDAAVPVGSIFGVFRQQSQGMGDVNDVLQPGNQLIAAGYAMYSSATLLVLSTGNGVNGFTLDPSLGEFILTHPNIRIPKRGNIYSVNEGNAGSWNDPVTEYVKAKKHPTKGTPYSLRYIGSMVGDIHRTLIYGGIFLYPEDKKSPNGKLRLLYECNPMSFIIEQAGGKSVAGKLGRVLDIKPDKIHQRVPIYIGSPEDIDEMVTYFK